MAIEPSWNCFWLIMYQSNKVRGYLHGNIFTWDSTLNVLRTCCKHFKQKILFFTVLKILMNIFEKKKYKKNQIFIPIFSTVCILFDNWPLFIICTKKPIMILISQQYLRNNSTILCSYRKRTIKVRLILNLTSEVFINPCTILCKCNKNNDYNTYSHRTDFSFLCFQLNRIL